VVRQIDQYPVYAAIHLFTFTELPGRASFAEFVDVEDINAGDDPVPAAFVRDWNVLRTGPHLGSAGRRLLALAASLAVGEQVGLAENLSGLGNAHARRVIEAIAIATGHGEMYAITATPALAEQYARSDRPVPDHIADVPSGLLRWQVKDIIRSSAVVDRFATRPAAPSSRSSRFPTLASL
jgi:hypothetical protein